MKSKTQILFLIILILVSCKTTSETNKNKELIKKDNFKNISIINLNDKVPERAIHIKTLEYGYNLLYTNCISLDSIISLAKFEAIQTHGNALKITKNSPVNAFNNECHKVEIDILKIEKSKNKMHNLGLEEFSTLNIYRYRGASLLKYDLYLEDSLICKVKSNFKKSIKFSKEGTFTLKTSNNEILKVNFKNGNDVYVKAGVKVNSIIEKPKLTLMSKEKGEFEFNSFNSNI